jgi:hypothetical protein
MNDLAKSPLDHSNLEAHEFANEFPMIEDAATFEGLRASIAKEGLHHPIVLYEGMILDGRNRYKAANEVGYKFKPTDFDAFNGTREQAKSLALTVNIHRRHLTDAQKQKLVKDKLKENPNLSDRAIARLCGVTHPTVSKVRKELFKPPEAPKEEQEFNAFVKAWDGLSSPNRIRFVKNSFDEIMRHSPVADVLQKQVERVSNPVNS